MMEEIDQLAHNLQSIAMPDSFLRRIMEQYKSGSYVNENYYKFLYGLVLMREPKIALELGVEWGLASAHMAAAAWHYGGHVVGVDRTIHQISGREIYVTYGNYTFMIGETTEQQVLEDIAEFVEVVGPIGVVYQDSSHHYAESIAEWEAYAPMLDKGAIWVCDDITPSFHDPKVDPPGKGMVQYFDQLPGTKKLYPDILHKGNTIGVILI